MKIWVKAILILAVAALAAAYAIIFIMYVRPNREMNKIREKTNIPALGENAHQSSIHFLNTGCSDAILIESDGHYALVDCAEDSDNPRDFPNLVFRGYENEVLGYLKKNCRSSDGKVHLDFILGTHAHSDHIGGFDTVIEDDDVIIDRAYLKHYDESIIRSSEIVEWDNKEVYEQTVNALNAKNVPIIADIEETKFMLGSFKITLFNTEAETKLSDIGENDNSMGVLVEKNGRRAFLAGDIDNYTGDEEMLAPQIGKVDILKVGHHSYSGSTTSDWLKTLDPDYAVITNNYCTDPTARRLTRICRCPILITGQEQGVMAVFGDDGTLSFYNKITDWESK